MMVMTVAGCVYYLFQLDRVPTTRSAGADGVNTDRDGQPRARGGWMVISHNSVR